MTESRLPSHHGITAASEQRAYPNRTIELLIERASCRSYTDDPIPPETLQLVLEAGARAASGGNLQPTSIIQTKDQATKDWFYPALADIISPYPAPTPEAAIAYLDTPLRVIIELIPEMTLAFDGDRIADASAAGAVPGPEDA